MPIVNPNQPSVAVQVPVPVPARTSPQKAAQRPLLPQLPQRPIPRQLSERPPQLKAIIMPFTPRQSSEGPDVKRMKRTGNSIRYSHEAFEKRAIEEPTNSNNRAIYADWLEENDPQSVSPKTLNFLRTHQGPAWIGRNRHGKVGAGKFWDIEGIRRASQSKGSHWFDPGTMRFFGTRLTKHVFSGPGGIYFVHSDHNFDRTRREYKVSLFSPKTGGTGVPTTYFHGAGGKEFGDHEQFAFPSITRAVTMAKRLALDKSGYAKNRNWKEEEHGSSVDSEEEQPTQMKRLPRKVIKYSLQWSNVTQLLKAARENPDNTTAHGEVADALDEEYPGNPIAGLIRRQFGIGGEPKTNEWGRPFLDLDYGGGLRIGKSEPFNITLNHTQSSNRHRNRWIVEAHHPDTKTMYTFEFPHQKAYLIPRMFPEAKKYINPIFNNAPDHSYRDQEATEFDRQVNEQERNR